MKTSSVAAEGLFYFQSIQKAVELSQIKILSQERISEAYLSILVDVIHKNIADIMGEGVKRGTAGGTHMRELAS